MDYYNKYVKYKTKYLNLKYDNNQYGGGVLKCEIEHVNFRESCWDGSILMILSFGDLTRDLLNDKINSFKLGNGSVIEQFIKDKIEKIKVKPLVS